MKNIVLNIACQPKVMEREPLINGEDKNNSVVWTDFKESGKEQQEMLCIMTNFFNDLKLKSQSVLTIKERNTDDFHRSIVID